MDTTAATTRTTEDLTDADIFALIDKVCNIPDERQPGEKTIQEMAAHWDCSEAAASSRLNRAWRAGKMTKRPGRVDGKNVVLYKVVGQ